MTVEHDRGRGPFPRRGRTAIIAILAGLAALAAVVLFVTGHKRGPVPPVAGGAGSAPRKEPPPPVVKRKIDAEGSLAHQRKGRWYAQRKRYPQAVKELRLAVDLNPLHAWTRCELSTALLQIKSYAEASAEAQDAIRLGGGDTSLLGAAYYCLGRALEELGDRAAAIQSYQRSLRLCPGIKTITERLVSLGAGPAAGAIPAASGVCPLRASFDSGMYPFSHEGGITGVELGRLWMERLPGSEADARADFSAVSGNFTLSFEVWLLTSASRVSLALQNGRMQAGYHVVLQNETENGSSPGLFLLYGSRHGKRPAREAPRDSILIQHSFPPMKNRRYTIELRREASGRMHLRLNGIKVGSATDNRASRFDHMWLNAGNDSSAGHGGLFDNISLCPW